MPSTLVECVQIISYILSGVGIIIAGVSYSNDRKIKRAEWLKSLFEKFYENDFYKDVRKWIDFEELSKELSIDDDHTKEEKLGDFLNFFEFIATLESENQIRLIEIMKLFSYYLILIKKSEICKEYIIRYKFRNLQKLLDKINNEN